MYFFSLLIFQHVRGRICFFSTLLSYLTLNKKKTHKSIEHFAFFSCLFSRLQVSSGFPSLHFHKNPSPLRYLDRQGISLLLNTLQEAIMHAKLWIYKEEASPHLLPVGLCELHPNEHLVLTLVTPDLHLKILRGFVFARFKASETMSIPVRRRHIYQAKIHNKFIAIDCITANYTVSRIHESCEVQSRRTDS